MIHIAIPIFQTLTEKNDPFKKYNVFDIHVNSWYHASVRYSSLYALHEKLIENFGFRLDAPDFPPKKLWRALDNKAINERREGLAKYLQGVIQNPDISRHHILERAFLDFQVSSFGSSAEAVTLEVFLSDGRPVNIECYSNDVTNVVLQKFARVIQLDESKMDCFGLFLSRPRNQDKDGSQENIASSSVVFDQLCVRWLKNFEAPYISQQLANKDSEENGSFYKVVVRRTCWDPSTEEPLLDDPGGLKLLYLQALNDVHRGVMKINPDIKDKLQAFQEQGNFRQFMRLCHLQPTYGYEILVPVISDYPRENTKCQLKVGRRQILLEYEDNGFHTQTALKSTRIRVWRVSHRDNQPISSQMLFQIEYLVAKEEFNVITLQTNQAVILSQFLQSIAAEILQDHRTHSPAFKFDDSVQTKVLEKLEATKASSIVSDDLIIKEPSVNYDSNESYESLHKLFKIISHTMPFDNDSFDDITDADL